MHITYKKKFCCKDEINYLNSDFIVELTAFFYYYKRQISVKKKSKK